MTFSSGREPSCEIKDMNLQTDGVFSGTNLYTTSFLIRSSNFTQMKTFEDRLPSLKFRSRSSVNSSPLGPKFSYSSSNRTSHFFSQT